MSDPSAVGAAPFVAVLAPYLNALAVAVAPLLVAWALSLFRKWTGVQVDAAYEKRLEAAAATEAGKAIAAAEPGFANAVIPLGAPIVKQAVENILSAEHLADVLAATGATPENVADLVAGEIGKLQARMTPTSAHI